MEKSADAFRTISEAAAELDVPQHVLRFWETKFPQIKPMKRGGGRRYYRPQDIELLRAIKQLLYAEGFTIKGVQRILKERGVRAVTTASHDGAPIATALSVSLTALDDDDAEPAAAEDLEPTSVRAGTGEEPADATAASAPAVEAEGPAAPAAPCSALRGQDVTRLREILLDLERCVEILAAARRS